jgi:hypothetical protein
VLKFILVKSLLGVSFAKIATQLNEMGIKTKNGAAAWTRCVTKQIVRRRQKYKFVNKRTRAPF